MKHDPQNKILAYLKAGGRLTVRKAERLYHTTELRRIISRLRKMGYSICSNKQKAVTEDGRPTQFNEYYYNQTTMNKYLQELKDKGLVPLRLDNNTVLWVTPDKANEKYKTRYLKNAERSRRMALNLD